jgi:hypothetical protein
MTTADRCTQFIMGLPSAGKTTFLAALWHTAESGDVEGALVLDRLTGDTSYISEIRDNWCDVRPLERTKAADEQIVSMDLRDPNTDVATTVVFPDLSGESFQNQWGDRRVEPTHAGILSDANGIILMIHPGSIRGEALIGDAQLMLNKLELEAEADEGDGSGQIGRDAMASGTANGTPRAWKPTLSPTQVVLVDLLQFVEALTTVRPIRLAVVISAWDVLTATGPQEEPEAWLESQLPLLHQFLRTNGSTFEYRCYGLSAQGGPLEDADELRKITRPSARIILAEAGHDNSNDITRPVKWLMESPGE